MSQRSSIILSFLSLAVLIVLYLVTTFGLVGHTVVGEGSTYNQPMIIPAGYAFSIWGLIYLGLIAYPFYQWFNPHDDDPRWTKINIYYSVNVILNGLWLVFATYEWLILTVIVIIAMFYTLYRINQWQFEMKNEGFEFNYLFEKLVFSIYFGWITLATALNITAALDFYNWNGFGLSDLTWSMIILSVAALLAAIPVRKYKDNAFAGVVIWAYTALIVRHYNSEPLITTLCAVVCGLFVILIILNLRDRTYRKLITEM
jgi:hypothetical protein